jgi:hypothetical protein
LYFSMTRILVNHVYYSPVGHVVEAIRYARGFHDANPGSEVHVAFSDGAPWELCAGAPWIARVYRIPVADPGSYDLSVPEMPREWDYIVDNNLMALEDEDPSLLVRPQGYEPPTRGWEEEATIAYYARTDAELVARRGRGVLLPEMSLPDGLGYDAACTRRSRYQPRAAPLLCVTPTTGRRSAFCRPARGPQPSTRAPRAGPPSSARYGSGSRAPAST